MRKIFLILASITMLTSCGNQVGKYVYVDRTQTFHIDRECEHIGKLPMGAVSSGVARCTAQEAVKMYNVRPCAYCVDDDIYEQITKNK